MTELERLQARCARLEATLGTLIGWMSGSAVSPISQAEARELLEILNRSLVQK
jgi:hypothetical protein